MAESQPHSNPQARLRDNAEALLRLRKAPSGRGWPVSIDALELLHNLAREPNSAADALKLLHELQVHQVELDMQQEQVESAEMECIRDLEHYRTLFEFAPLAYLVIDATGMVVEANLLAGEILKVLPEELPGRPIVDFFEPGQRAELQSGLTDLHQQKLDTVCKLERDYGGNEGARLRILAGRMPSAEAILVTLVECGTAQKSP